VLRHPFNLGIGGAVQSGFVFAFDNDYDYMVQVDGDGQHDPTQLPELVRAMNELQGGEPLIDAAELEHVIVERDRQVSSGLGKDAQVTATAAARRYLVDRVIRVAKPHRLLDPAAGPLIAVRLSILTRKTLGGLHTDLDGRVLQASGEPLGGLYAAGEVAGFGGGGVHGYRALEGTFLGGCLFSGRVAAG